MRISRSSRSSNIFLWSYTNSEWCDAWFEWHAPSFQISATISLCGPVPCSPCRRLRSPWNAFVCGRLPTIKSVTTSTTLSPLQRPVTSTRRGSRSAHGSRERTHLHALNHHATCSACRCSLPRRPCRPLPRHRASPASRPLGKSRALRLRLRMCMRRSAKVRGH